MRHNHLVRSQFAGPQSLITFLLLRLREDTLTPRPTLYGLRGASYCMRSSSWQLFSTFLAEKLLRDTLAATLALLECVNF